MEGRRQHQKIRSKLNDSGKNSFSGLDPLKKEATPIKEEEFEDEDFDVTESYSRPINSNDMSGAKPESAENLLIEEARNYDSQLSGSKSVIEMNESRGSEQK